MNPHFQRASLLYDQSRYEEAERELRQSLAIDPNCARSHALFGMCLAERKQFDEAEQFVRRAIALEPGEPGLHAALGQVLFARNDLKGAADALDEALAIDPHDEDLRTFEAQIQIQRKNWRAAIDAADMALEIDAENSAARNLRALAIRNLRQRSSAEAELLESLRRDPEDALAHANLGWLYLETGRLDLADRHFREALRLEPEYEWARVGVLDTLKARVPVYRLLLNYFLWMQRKSASSQWMVIVGAFIAYRIVLALQERNPQLGWVLWPLMAAYLAFVLMTWFGQPLANGVLVIHPFGRLALTRYEKFEAAIVGGGVLLTIALAACYLLIDYWPALLLALSTGAVTIPLTIALKFRSPRPRLIMLCYTSAVFVLSLPFLILALVGEWVLVAVPHETALEILRRSGALLGLSPLGAFVLGNLLATRTWRD